MQSVPRNIELDYTRNLYQSIPDHLNIVSLKWRVISLHIKMILKLDLPQMVLKLVRVKCKQTGHIESDEYFCPPSVVCIFRTYQNNQS